LIYLDWNASAPLSAAARAAMEPWWSLPGNASSVHGVGRAAALAVESARRSLALHVGARPAEVVFTSGATEANATVLARGRWLVSAVEHPSVRAWGAAELPVDGDGVVRLGEVDPAGFDGVSVMLANNETGVLQPVEEVLAWARRHGLLTHVDAAQGPGRVPIAVAADFLTLSGHKAGGPQGVGALVARRPVEPLLRGGAQERGRRAGTHAVAAIVGFAAALDGARVGPEARDALETGVGALGGRVLGARAPRLPNTSCVQFDGVDAADLVAALDLEGVAVSSGAACASGSVGPSHVLVAMGVEGGAVRFSTGPSTRDLDITDTLSALARVLARFRA